MSEEVPEVVVKPHSGPRDLADILVGVLVAIPTLGVLYGIPAAIVVALGGSWTLALVAAALGAALFTLFISPLFTVRSLTVSATGVRFDRVLGRPRMLRWEQIRRIRPAKRVEVVLWGWLLPPFPAREATRSTSSIGHVCIEWGRRYRYFPPHDPRMFEQVVGRWHAIEPDEIESPPDEPTDYELPAVAETGNPYQPPHTMS